jgi:hypothetical protein
MPDRGIVAPMMANGTGSGADSGPQRYRIVVRGRLSERFAATFADMALEPTAGETALVGYVRDQSQLYGLLDCLRDFGLELVSVEREARA